MLLSLDCIPVWQLPGLCYVHVAALTMQTSVQEEGHAPRVLRSKVCCCKDCSAHVNVTCHYHLCCQKCSCNADFKFTSAGGLFSSVPAFGQQSAAATSNLFGASQAGFGAPQSTPATANAFGAPNGGLFGTPQSSPAMFGTPTSTTFGAAAPSSSGFGQSPLFGASNSTTFGKPAQSTTAKKNKGGRR